MDNAITGVCTSQIVMTRPGHGIVYLYERDQLNRAYSTYTPRWGDLLLKPPDTKLCHAYEKKRDEYTRGRNELFLRKLKENMELALQPTAKDAVSQILENPDPFTKNGKLNVTEIRLKFGVGKDKAYHIRDEVEYKRRISPLSSNR